MSKNLEKGLSVAIKIHILENRKKNKKRKRARPLSESDRELHPAGIGPEKSSKNQKKSEKSSFVDIAAEAEAKAAELIRAAAKAKFDEKAKLENNQDQEPESLMEEDSGLPMESPDPKPPSSKGPPKVNYGSLLTKSA